MSDYKQLEQKIQELQDEHQRKVNELQAEVDRLKSKEKKSKLPGNFNGDVILKFLSDPNYIDLRYSFSWIDTPQGFEYWSNIYSSLYSNKSYKVPDEAIIQLQKWVIMSYQQQYGA